MKTATRTVEFPSDATIDDLFELFASCTMPEGISEHRFLVTKNAYYQGINALLSILSSATGEEDFLKKCESAEAHYAQYEASLHGTSG